MATILIGIAISLVISFALSMISGVITKLLAKKPKKQSLGFDDRTDTSLGVIDPQEFAFGELRKGGTIIYKRTTTDKQDMWIVVALAGHESEEIAEIWLGNEPQLIHPDGSITSLGATDYSANVFCYVHLGTDDQTVDTNLQAVFGQDWTEDHKLAGITHTVTHFIYDVTLFAQGIPNPSWKGRWYNQIYDPRTGLTSYNDNAILCARAYLANTVFGLSIVDTELEDTLVASEASVCDEQVMLPPWVENFDADAFSHTFTVTSIPNDQMNTGETAKLTLEHIPTGTSVTVSTTNTLPPPLLAGTTYYVHLVSPGLQAIWQLHPTHGDSLANTNRINITGAGTGVHTVVSVVSGFSFIGRSTTFTASAAANTITLEEYVLGCGAADGEAQAVVVLTSTLTTPAPTVSTDRYILQGTSGSKVCTLSTISPFAAVDLTTAGTGTMTLTVVGLIYQVSFTTGIDSIFLLAATGVINGSYIGKPMRFRSTPFAGETPELVDRQIYYMIPLTANSFSIAETAEDARTGAVKPVVSAAGFVGYFESLEIPQDEILNCGTGAVVQIAASSSGNLPLPFEAGTDYIFSYLSRGRFALATSLADAFAGNYITATDAGTDPNLTYSLFVKSERRYVTAGVFDAEQEYGEVLKGLLSACAGRFVPPGEDWLLYAGTWRVPLTTLTKDMVRSGGKVKLQTRQARRDLINTIVGTYASPANFDQPSNFPTVADTTAITEDGSIISNDIVLPFTGSKWTALRLVLIELRRARCQRVLNWDSDIGIFDFTVNETCEVDFDELNLDGLFFELVSIELGIEQSNDSDGPIPTFDLVLRETNPFVYQDVLGTV